MRVSETMEISQIASYLGLVGDEVFRRLVDRAAEFGFTTDRQEVRFGESKREAFITEMDKDFASWGCKDIKACSRPRAYRSLSYLAGSGDT